MSSKNIIIQTPNYSKVLQKLVASSNVRGLTPRNFKNFDIDGETDVLEMLNEVEINIIACNTVNFIYKLVKSVESIKFDVLSTEEIPGLVDLCNLSYHDTDEEKIMIAMELMYPTPLENVDDNVDELDDYEYTITEQNDNSRAELRNIRLELGLTQEDLELLSNSKFSQAQISYIETGAEPISAEYSRFVKNLKVNESTKSFIDAHADLIIMGMRNLLNLKISDVESKLKISASTISRIERGYSSDKYSDIKNYLRNEINSLQPEITSKDIDFIKKAMQLKFVSPNLLVELLKDTSHCLPKWHSSSSGVYNVLSCENKKPFTYEHYLELLRILNNIPYDIDALIKRKKMFSKSTFFTDKRPRKIIEDTNVNITNYANTIESDNIVIKPLDDNSLTTVNCNNIQIVELNLQAALQEGYAVTNDSLAAQNKYIQIVDGKLCMFTLIKEDNISLPFDEILRKDWRLKD